MSETAAEKFTTWACRNAAHATCGGIGFRMMPSGVDLPCVCPCHAQAMSETQARPAVGDLLGPLRQRTAERKRPRLWEIDIALARVSTLEMKLARVTAERDRAREERDAMVGVVIAARGVVNCVDIESQSRERIEVHINGGGCLVDLRDSVARLDAQQEPDCLCKHAIAQAPGEPTKHDPRCPQASEPADA